MDSPESPAQSDRTSSSTASLSGRNHLADADSSLIRKRPRLTPPTGSDEPLVLEVFQPDEPDEQPPVIEIMTDDLFEDVLHLETFPLAKANTTPEDVAQHLANAFNDNRKPVTDYHIQRLQIWLSDHINATQHMPETEMHRMYIEMASFWAQISRCFEALVHRRHLSAQNAHTEPLHLRDFDDLFLTFTTLCVRLFRAEVHSLTEVTIRRDSASSVDNCTKHTLLFSPFTDILSRVISGTCSLVKLIADHSQAAATHLRSLVVARFASEVGGSEALAQLFSNILANTEVIHHAYTPLRTCLLLARGLLGMIQDAHANKQNVIRHMTTIFHCGDVTLISQICKIHPSELSPDYHIEVLTCLRDVLAKLIDQGQSPIAEQFALSMRETIEYVGIPIYTGAVASTSEPCENESQPRICLAWHLEVLRKFLTSSIMALRVTGLTALNLQLVHVWNQRRVPIVQDSLVQYAIRFHLKNSLIAYMLGSDSHADLIRRSGETVGFLIATKCLLESEMDVLWHAAFANQKSDIGEAASSLLFRLVQSMDRHQIMHFCRKYLDLSTVQVNLQSLKMLNHLIEYLVLRDTTEHCPDLFFEATCICLGVLQTASWEEHESLHTLLSTLPDLVSKTDNRDQRLSILQTCASGLTKQRSSATGSVHAIWALWQAELLTPEDLMGVLTMHEISQDLYEYVRLACNDSENWSVKHLTPRLTLVISLLAWLSDMDNGMADTDPNRCSLTEKEFWSYCIGDNAIDNHARNCAWAALVTNAKTPSKFLDRCISEYLPNLEPEYATGGFFSLYGLMVETGNQEQGFHFPLQDDVVRFALTSPNDSLAAHAAGITISALFSGQALQYPEEVIPKQVAVAERCMEVLRAKDASATRALHLLRCLLQSSLGYEQRAGLQQNYDLSEQPIFVETDTKKQGQQLTAFVYAGQNQPTKRSVFVNEETTIIDLHAAVSAATGFTEFLVIAGGQVQDLTNDASMTVREKGLLDKVTILIKRINTPHSVQEESDKKTGRTAVERAAFQHFDELFAYIDDSDALSEQMLGIIMNLPAPKPIRQMVTSSTTSSEHMFPETNIWKVLYFVHILLGELLEQTSAGVADEGFLLHGVHSLIDLLNRHSASENAHVLGSISRALLMFLRERPVKDESDKYFDRPTLFVTSILATMDRIQWLIGEKRRQATRPSTASQEDMTQLESVRNLYLCLIEGCRLDAEVHASFKGAENIVSLHIALLLNRDVVLSTTIADCIRNECKLELTSAEMKAFFWSVVSETITEARKHPTLAINLFRIAPDVLRSDRSITECEPKLRSLIADFTEMILGVEHEEQFEHGHTDWRIFGLCELLLCIIVCLKSFKQPLQLGNLAASLFQKFLFPSTAAQDVSETPMRPAVAPNSRHSVYRLIEALCEDLQTLNVITSLVLQAVESADHSSYHDYDSLVRTQCGYSGLVNLQQTCYMNALLQQLFMNVPFRKFILDTPISCQDKQQVLGEFKAAFAYMQDSYGLAFCPDSLARALDVDVTVQDDAHIFFTTLIGKLEDSMPTEETRGRLKVFFGGMNKSQTVGECGHVSESPDEYFNLSLVVKDKTTLKESLDEYVTGAPLEGGDKFKCVTCDPNGEGVYVNAMRRTGLEHIPDNLVLGLKRFRYETYDGGAKVNDRFDFPEQIDMSPYKMGKLARPEDSVEQDIFQLVGVVVHYGTLQFGHYWSYAAQRPSSGTQPLAWYRLEDSQATSCTIGDVLKETRGGPGLPDVHGQVWARPDSAYVLFYERMSSIEATRETISAEDPKASLLRSVYPKVPIPEDLHDKIASENENFLRLLNIHAPEHATFVKNLLLKVDVLTKGQPTADHVIEGKAIDMVFQHLRLVTIHSQHLEHLDEITASLLKLSCADSYNSTKVIESICKDVQTESLFAFSRKQAVRISTNRLIIACLAFLREKHPEIYGLGLGHVGALHQVLDSHTGLRGWLEQNRTVWSEFFGLIVQLAAFGPHETAVLLDHGYLGWCLEVLLISHDVYLKNKHPDLWFHKDHGRNYAMQPLVNCIHALLVDHVDLSDISNQIERREAYFCSRNNVLLNKNEASLIEATDIYGRNFLLREACLTAGPQIHGPSTGDLAILLTNPAVVDNRVSESACNAIEKGIRRDNDFASFAAVATACIVSGYIEKRRTVRFIRLVAQLHTLFTGAEDCIMHSMASVFPTEPQLVLDSLRLWVVELLACDDFDLEERALEWLRRNVLSVDPVKRPFDGTRIALVISFITALNAVSGQLLAGIKDGYDHRQDHGLYERMIQAFDDCVAWLLKAIHTIERDLETDSSSLASSETAEETTGREIESDRFPRTPQPSNAQLMENLMEVAQDARDIIEQYERLTEEIRAWPELEISELPLRRQKSQGAVMDLTDDTEVDDTSTEEWDDESLPEGTA